MIKRESDECSIMQYSSLRSPDAVCPYDFNHRLTEADKGYLWEDFGKPSGNIIEDIDAFIDVYEGKSKIIVPPVVPPDVDPCEDAEFMSLYYEWRKSSNQDYEEFEHYRDQIQEINIILLNL